MASVVKVVVVGAYRIRLRLLFPFKIDDSPVIVFFPVTVFVENPIKTDINGIYLEHCSVVCGRICDAKDKSHSVRVFHVGRPGVFHAICYKTRCVLRCGLCFYAMFVKIFPCRVDIKGKIVIKHEPIIVRRERIGVKVEINVDKDRLYAVFRRAVRKVVNLLTCRMECRDSKYDNRKE